MSKLTIKKIKTISQWLYWSLIVIANYYIAVEPTRPYWIDYLIGTALGFIALSRWMSYFLEEDTKEKKSARTFAITMTIIAFLYIASSIFFLFL